MAALCALEMLSFMSSEGLIYVMWSALLDVFHTCAGHTPEGGDEFFEVSAAYVADRMLPKHLRRRLSLTTNTTAWVVREQISMRYMVPQSGLLPQLSPADIAFTTSGSIGTRDAMELRVKEKTNISQLCLGRVSIRKECWLRNV